jgi:6,7-dimethyl-8-ribityllumazine synthase
MQTSITINYPNVPAVDAEKLIRFFEAIGLQFRGSQAGRKDSGLFSAPIGAVAINMLPSASTESLSIGINNPDVIFEIARKFGFKVIGDTAHPDTAARSFSIQLAGTIVLNVVGGPPEPLPSIDGKLDARGMRLGIVVSRFNAFITERLLHGALDALHRAGAKTKTVVRVPGAFEIPSAARTLAETKKYDAVICLGCLLRGDTAHYDVIVNEVARGIGQSAQETGVPHAFGVLTCDTLEQAIDRAGLKMGNKGFEAALAAVEMANLKKAVVGRESSVVGKTKPPRVVRRPSHAKAKASNLVASSVTRESQDVARRASPVARKSQSKKKLTTHRKKH